MNKMSYAEFFVAYCQIIGKNYLSSTDFPESEACGEDNDFCQKVGLMGLRGMWSTSCYLPWSWGCDELLEKAGFTLKDMVYCKTYPSGERAFPPSYDENPSTAEGAVNSLYFRQDGLGIQDFFDEIKKILDGPNTGSATSPEEIVGIAMNSPKSSFGGKRY